MEKDFTLKKYQKLCEAIMANEYQTSTISDYLQHASENATVLIRHDVDRKPESALRMARLERRLGIDSTYYFRHTPNVFLPDIIQKISSLNHEIGYHYETLSKCKGNFGKAITLFKKELDDFRQYVPVSTISMHGRPFSKWDNRDLWQKYDLKDFDLLGECYLSIDYRKVTYLSDTGRTWHPGRYNLRDHVEGHSPDYLETTDDLILYISQGRKETLCLLTHPNRWANSSSEWFFEATVDLCANRAKQILAKIRSSKASPII